VFIILCRYIINNVLIAQLYKILLIHQEKAKEKNVLTDALDDDVRAKRKRDNERKYIARQLKNFKKG
jgi:hypothetical protein